MGYGVTPKGGCPSRPHSSHTSLGLLLTSLSPPGGSDEKESTRNVGDQGSFPGLGRCPGGGHGKPLQNSRLENLTDGGDWRDTVHGVAESDTTERLTLSEPHFLDKEPF